MVNVKTQIATSDTKTITIRGHDLVEDLIGQRSFTDMIFFLVCGRMPTARQSKLLDACLVTLAQHGWTPTSIIARLAFDSVPSQAQVAIAAGLLAVGDVFVGTIEGCARILAQGIHAPDRSGFCRQVVAEHRSAHKSVPGFGHPFHKPDDPRPPKLFAVARDLGFAGSYIELLQLLGAELDRVAGRHVTINATGAVAAVLLEIEISPEHMRSIGVISRSAGLAGHLAEEQRNHAARTIWSIVEEQIPYESTPP
jgi:citrate synthase